MQKCSSNSAATVAVTPSQQLLQKNTMENQFASLFIVSLYSHCWEMKARGGRHKKRKLPCLSRNWWLSIHGVCAFLTPSSTSRGASGAFPFLRPQPRLFLLEKTGRNLELCADPSSSALQLASLAFVLEVEAVGVVVGAQGAGEARGHGGVTQARLPLAPALPITCGTGGNTEPCGAFPGRSHRGESAACPGPCPPQNPIELSQAGGSGAGFPQGMLSRVPGSGMGCVGQQCPELTAGDVPVAGAEAVQGAQGAALALPQPPVAAVVGLAAPAGTPHQTAAPNPPRHTRRAGEGPASNLGRARRGGGKATAGLG